MERKGNRYFSHTQHTVLARHLIGTLNKLLKNAATSADVLARSFKASRIFHERLSVGLEGYVQAEKTVKS